MQYHFVTATWSMDSGYGTLHHHHHHQLHQHRNLSTVITHSPMLVNQLSLASVILISVHLLTDWTCSCKTCNSNVNVCLTPFAQVSITPTECSLRQHTTAHVLHTLTCWHKLIPLHIRLHEELQLAEFLIFDGA